MANNCLTIFEHCRKKREIFPNDGFLVQLMELDEELRKAKDS